MAITREDIGTIENLETGEIETLTAATCDTAEDLAEFFGVDLAELQERAELEGWD